jgi:hypothetical protein
MVRAGVCGFILYEILLTSFSDLGRLPAVLLRPTGAMQILSWRFYYLLLTPAGMIALKWLVLSRHIPTRRPLSIATVAPVCRKIGPELYLT